MSNNTISLEIGGRLLSIEIGRMGRQADGTAFIKYGDTIMFISATSKKEVKEPKPFLPLIVDYRENTYAAGKFPGGFFKREGRPSEREILTSRLIDRPVRPLFPDGYFNDTQIVALLLSADLQNEPDTLGIIGASAALYFSDIPFTTPLGAVKVGYLNDEFIINPTVEQLEESTLNMVVVGTEEGIIMAEAGAEELKEETIAEAAAFCQDTIQQIIKAQKELYQKLNIIKREFKPKELDQERYKEIENRVSSSLIEAIKTEGKKAQEEKIKTILDKLLSEIPEEDEDKIEETREIFFQLEKKLVRRTILEEKKRTDGRSLNEIRPISIEVGILPRTHGSAVFTRGETQCLATVTLGSFEDVQRLNGLNEGDFKRFMLHYNFPPFSVGEVAFLRGPGRREIGHGALAEKSILPAIPTEDDFPYTIRIVSDILESNGSSSMATVCGGILSLMEAGVPLSMIIAGIAMGLVKEENQHILLTDIAGLEDHFGDMDLKVAGSENGITAIQMDLKIPSIPLDVFKEGLVRAREARLKVLEKMKEVLPQPRPEISPFAPKIIIIFINPEKVGDVIGPAGKHIKKILAETGAKIDVEETGKIVIAAETKEAAERAREMIREITIEAEVGKVYTGKVVRVEDYGAFVEILPNIVGLLHVSEIAHQRTRSARDIFKLGDTVKVKVLAIDQDNKIKLSKKALIKLEDRPFNRDNSLQKKSHPKHGYKSDRF